MNNVIDKIVYKILTFKKNITNKPIIYFKLCIQLTVLQATLKVYK